MVKESRLIRLIFVNTDNAHDLTPAAELLCVEEKFVYEDAGYQGFAKRLEMADNTKEFRVAMQT